MLAYLCETPDLFDGHVESEKIERLAAHSGKVVHPHGLLFSEGQVSIHPHLPLGLWTQLVQPGDLLIGDGGGAGLLWDTKPLDGTNGPEEKRQHNHLNLTFFDSGLGVPSTLLLIFWAWFILSMPNSEPGAIPEGLTEFKFQEQHHLITATD